MVKRFLVLTLTLLLCVSLFVPASYAEDDGIDRDEIYTVLKNAVEIRYALTEFFPWFDGNHSINAYGAGCWQVAEGYSPDEVRALVRDTFSEQYAEAINGADRFFRFYVEENGLWFYLHTTSQYGDYVRFVTEDDDIRNFKIVSSDKNELTVSFPVYFERDYTVTIGPHLESPVFVMLSKIDGKWKITDYDISPCLLTADASVMKGDSFTKEMAAESIKAAIYEIFNYNEVDAFSLWDRMVTLSDSPESLENPETWKKYADGFMLSAVSDELLRFNKYLTLENGKVVISTKFPPYTFFFLYESISDSKIDIISSDSSSAMVQYYLHEIGPQYDAVLDISYIKTDDGWRISDAAFVNDIRLLLNGAENVQTGDDTAAFAAVTVLILAACVMIAWKKQMFVRFKKTF